MDGWDLGAAGAASIGLMVFATLNLALRMPSRVRLAEQFESRRSESEFERFVAIRPQYMLATAFLRSVFTLALFFIVLGMIERAGPPTERTGDALAFVCALILVLVFGVAIPNAWAKYAGEWMIVRTIPLLGVVRLLCYPVTVVLEGFDPLVRRLAGVPARNARSYADELEQEILKAVSEGERHGAVDEEEKEMIESVIKLSDRHVEEIMTPRTDVVAIPKEATRQDLLETIRATGHSRIPVYDETIDTVLGAIYAKDLLRQDEEAAFDIKGMMREVYFIPETKLVRELLREFQARKIHLAIVLDEYGGTAGLVTIEDILEELVGEIEDEYETTAPEELVRIDDRTVEVDARMRIDDLNGRLHLELPESEDYETIGGYVFSALGRIPRVGEGCSHNDLGIQVIAAEPRRIVRLRLRLPGNSTPGQPVRTPGH